MESQLNIRNRYATQTKPTTQTKLTSSEGASADRRSGIASKEDDILGTYLLGSGACVVSSLVGGFITYVANSLIEDFKGFQEGRHPESQSGYIVLVGASIAAIATTALTCRTISKLEDKKSYYDLFDNAIVTIPQRLENKDEIIHFLNLFGAKEISNHYDDNTTVLIVNNDVDKTQIQTKKNKNISILTVAKMDKIINDFTEIDIY
jgi:hypothetical protein